MTFEKWVIKYFGKDVAFPEACRDAYVAGEASGRKEARKLLKRTMDAIPDYIDGRNDQLIKEIDNCRKGMK